MEIDISYNKLTHFNFNLGSLPLLTLVSLYSNQLTYLTEYAFKSYILGNKSKDTSLIVSHNNITCLSEIQWILGISKEINTMLDYDDVCYNNINCSLRCIFRYYVCNNKRNNCLRG